MALSRVGGTSAAATSIAIPAHVAGDLIVIWAFRDGSTTPPTVPTAAGTVPAFTVIDNPTGANACSAVCAWAVAAGTTDTSGTWTNATGISVEVWRGASSAPIGDHQQTGASVASGANIVVPAITPGDLGGGEVFLSFVGWTTVTAWNAPPAGYTQRSQVATEVEAITKDTTTSDGTFNVTGTASAAGGTRRQQIEIIPDLGNRVSQEAVEVVYTTTAAAARVSQAVVEVLARLPGNLGNRVSQVAVEALIKIPKRFTATIAGVGSLTANVAGNKIGTAVIAGTSSLTATFNRFRRITPTIAGTSSLTAAVVNRAITATIAGTSAFVATLNRTIHVTANVAGTSSLSATVSTGGVVKTFTATIAGTSSLRAATAYILHTSAVITLDADDLTSSTPLLALSAGINIEADAPLTAGTYQPSSGVIKLAAGSATQPTLVQPSAGVIIVRGDTPKLFSIYQPVTGKILVRGDSPTVIPYSTPSAVIKLIGGSPGSIPTSTVSARIILTGGPPNVFPLQVNTSAAILVKGDPFIVAHVGYIIDQSGIIRLRSDVPIVTPLTEPPPPPPPPPPGTGLAVSGTE